MNWISTFQCFGGITYKSIYLFTGFWTKLIDYKTFNEFCSFLISFVWYDKSWPNCFFPMACICLFGWWNISIAFSSIFYSLLWCTSINCKLRNWDGRLWNFDSHTISKTSMLCHHYLVVFAFNVRLYTINYIHIGTMLGNLTHFHLKQLKFFIVKTPT